MIARTKRRAASVAIVIVLSLLGGCGGGDDSNPKSLLDVLRTFNSALARGDGERACELLSDQRRKEITENQTGANRDCAHLLASFSKPGQLESRKVKSLSSAQLGPVTYTGNVATVEVTTGEFGTGIAQLERQPNGEWRVIESAAATGFF